MAEEALPSVKGGLPDECLKDIDHVKNTIHCDPCKDDATQIEATLFCVDCNDFLCYECVRAHKRARFSKNHVLKDKEDMPKAKAEVHKEKCQHHSNEAINSFCETHDTTLCDVCSQVDHRNCINVKPLTEVSQNFLTSEKLKQIMDRLSGLRQELKETLPSIRMNTANIDTYYTMALAGVTKHISKIKDEDMANMKALEKTCAVSVAVIDSALNTIETMKQKNEEVQAFLAARKAESEFKTIEVRLISVKDDNQITKYRYVPYPTAEVLLEVINSWPKLDEINVKTPSDLSNCYITGMERLSNNRLVIADRNNNKIKLVDVTTKTVTSELMLEVGPWDLAPIDSNTIAVTTYTSKKLLFVSLSSSGTLTFDRPIDKSGYKQCQGIVRSNDTLAVSYSRPDQIEILNVDGTVKHVIEKRDDRGTVIDDGDARGTVRFGDVKYLTESPDTNILYLSDKTTHSVSSMTQDGLVISRFSHEHLKYPTGIAMGGDGRLFVCSYKTHKIFAVSSDLSEGQAILEEKDGLTNPQSIVYSEDEFKLYVGGSNNTIHVFLL